MSNPTSLEHDVADGMDDVRKRLSEASPEILLRAFASYTHRIHAARVERPELEVRLRTERGLVEEELLRRLSGAQATG